ncbi:3-dehydroquinate synthase [Candidatus Blochmanniella vafra]|nr:3-dehydroquinate synthase [Candidatus Blochmannia vafer]
MKRIFIELQERSYFVYIAHGILKDTKFRWKLKKGDVAVLITDIQVAPLYLKRICNTLNSFGVITDRLVLPVGEQSKSLSVLDQIFTKLLNKNYDRNIVLIALGGGVIGDLTGFAAATYHRGIRLIQVPTTLLAQVDASVGGKTGINHVLGKNMIGAFYQPVEVIIDLDCLFTLSMKEFSAGLAEVIKYAVAFDASFFNWLENNLDDLLKFHPQSLMYCVYRCCKLKASIVSLDEREIQIGKRSLLNLGHTYGHAIESYFSYTGWSHGEAISVGIVMAVNAALHLQKFLSTRDAMRIKLLLERAHLPVHGPQEMQSKDYLRYMARDKKSRLGKINLVLPVSIGRARVFLNIDQNVILNSIEYNLIK